MAALFLLVAVSGLFAAGPDGTDTPSLLQRLIVAPFVAIALWIIVGVLRQGVWTSPAGITVRNVFRRYYVPWSDVAAIEPPAAYGKMGNAGLQIVLTNGERISVALFAAGPFSRSTHADSVIEALRSDLERCGRTEVPLVGWSDGRSAARCWRTDHPLRLASEAEDPAISGGDSGGAEPAWKRGGRQVARDHRAWIAGPTCAAMSGYALVTRDDESPWVWVGLLVLGLGLLAFGIVSLARVLRSESSD